MICSNCGSELPENVKFCSQCGTEMKKPHAPRARVKPTGTPQKSRAHIGKIEGKQVSENIFLCNDGVYRWFYELSMLKNPAILITILKIFFFIFIGIFGFVLLLNLIQGNPINLDVRDWFAGPSKYAIVTIFVVFPLLILLSYLIVAALYGWKYCVLFEMDERGIKHTIMERQFEKTKGIRILLTLIGVTQIASGHIAQGGARNVGLGLLTSGHRFLYCPFMHVKSMKINRSMHQIKLHSHFAHNQIFMEDSDFDFVEKYIREHVSEKAKIHPK